METMDKKELEKYKKSLMECSKNDDGKPVTLRENEVYFFDDISDLEGKKYRNGKKMHSADALYLKDDGSAFLFEFKNVRKSNVPWKSTKMKAHDSLLTMQIMLNAKISLDEWMAKTTYFVIYNDAKTVQKENESKHFEKIKTSLKEIAKEQIQYPVFWNLDLYEGVFYRKVYTIDVKDFEDFFLPQIFD